MSLIKREKREELSWRKGKKLSEEHKMRISEARIRRKRRLGYLNSFETRRKISEALKGTNLTEEHKRNLSGKKPWNKGLTKETDDKVRRYSELLKGKSKSEAHRKNLSEAHKGNKPTKETRKKKSEAFKGEKNPMFGKTGEKSPGWLGGKSFEPYDKTFNRRFKKFIRERDNQICILCNISREKLKRALDVHHIDYNKLNSISQNCISLCRICHNKTNSNRKHWTIFFQSLLKEKYGYKY